MNRAVILLTLIGLLISSCGQPTSRPNPTRAPTATAPAVTPAAGTPMPTATASALSFRIEGLLERIDDDTWIVDGVRIEIDRTRLPAVIPTAGAWVVIDGIRTDDGRRILRTVTTTTTVEVAGRLDRIERDIWVIGGTPVFVAPTTRIVAPPRPGSYIRALARTSCGDDDDDGDCTLSTLYGLRIERATEITFVGQVTSITSTSIILDDREIILAPGTPPPAGVVVGSPARIVVRVDDDEDDDSSNTRLIFTAASALPTATVINGTLNALGADFVVVNGERFQLGRGALLWNLWPSIGRTVRIVIDVDDWRGDDDDDNGFRGNLRVVLAIIVIQIPQLLAPVVPPPTPAPVIIAPPPAPAPAVRPPAPPARPPARNSDDDDNNGSRGGGGDDDDDDGNRGRGDDDDD
jgi:hypothetical protein